MNRTKSRITLLLSLASVFVLALGGLAASGQQAAAGVVVGSGTLSPGLSDLHVNGGSGVQHVTFTGTGVGVVADASPDASAPFTCSFTGDSDMSEGYDLGHGHVSGGCGGGNLLPPPPTLSGSCNGLTYTRVGGAVTVYGNCAGDVSGYLVAACLFEPTSAPTVTSYQLQCLVGGQDQVDTTSAASTVDSTVTGLLH